MLVDNKWSSNMTIIDKAHSLDVHTVKLLIGRRFLADVWSSSWSQVMLIQAWWVQVANKLGGKWVLRVSGSLIISQLHGSRFMTSCEDVSSSNATRWSEKIGTTGCGCVNSRNYCWMVVGNTGICDPRYMDICCETGWARRLDDDRWKSGINKENEIKRKHENRLWAVNEDILRRCRSWLNMTSK